MTHSSSQTAKQVFIRDLKENQQINDIFLVSRFNLAETKAGKPYLALGLMDKSGEIEARLWDRAEQLASLAQEGSFVAVQATVDQFNGQLQLKLLTLATASEETLALNDFFPTSRRPQKEMLLELKKRIKSIQDDPLRRLMATIFKGDTLARFAQAPAAKKMHHAYLGGLIEHTLSMAHMAEAVARHYPLINADLLLAGVLLHDLAKIDEFDCTRPPFNYTDRGRLVGHLVLGVEMLRRAADTVEGLSQDTVDQLAHLILSHHGQLEFGSPVLPMTPEALLLHHIDDMDAKMNYIEGLQAQMHGEELQWTAFQRPLQRYLYLRGSTGDDAGEDEFSAGKKRQVKDDAAAQQQLLWG